MRADTGKYYYNHFVKGDKKHGLDLVCILNVGDGEGSSGDGIVCEELRDSVKFMSLRNEIYRYEYLQGMPENELLYFSNMVELSRLVPVWSIRRSPDMKLSGLKDAVEGLL